MGGLNLKCHHPFNVEEKIKSISGNSLRNYENH